MDKALRKHSRQEGNQFLPPKMLCTSFHTCFSPRRRLESFRSANALPRPLPGPALPNSCTTVRSYARHIPQAGVPATPFPTHSWFVAPVFFHSVQKNSSWTPTPAALGRRSSLAIRHRGLDMAHLAAFFQEPKSVPYRWESQQQCQGFQVPQIHTGEETGLPLQGTDAHWEPPQSQHHGIISIPRRMSLFPQIFKVVPRLCQGCPREEPLSPRMAVGFAGSNHSSSGIFSLRDLKGAKGEALLVIII